MVAFSTLPVAFHFDFGYSFLSQNFIARVFGYFSGKLIYRSQTGAFLF